MPPGRRPNLDRKIEKLIVQLKQALVAREQQRIEAQVSKGVDDLAIALAKGFDVGGSVAAPPLAGTAAVAGTPRKRRPRSASPASHSPRR